MNHTSNKNIRDILMAKTETIGNWIFSHIKIVMPVVLAICVILTVVISVNANKKEADKQEDIEANNTIEEQEEVTNVVPEVALQENSNPEISNLINQYYSAMASGNIDDIKALVSSIDDEQILRIEEISKYVDSYPSLDIYTKDGPTENTYLVYVSSEVKFTDYEKPIPGMNTYYVCTDENGRFYINFDDDDEEVLDYIRKVCLQDDVVDLNNKVAAAYNDMTAEDADLAQFLLDFYEEIDKSVGEALALAEDESGAEDADTQTEGEQSQETETASVVTKVKATDVVNIRSSDSETADKLGKAAIGDEFKLLEKIGNGWSKIEYEGKDAYIKSEYLEDVEEAEVADNSQESTDTPAQETTDNTQTNGYVTVKENVRIRSSASENGEKLGTAYVGEKLELIMKQADGWTKIKYNGKTAYVKSDYVE